MSAPGLRLRESPRVAVAGRARLLLATGGMTVDATVLDLSTTGMGLATAVAAPKPSVGDACAFELTVDGVRIEGRGVVVWSRRARPDRGDAPNVGVRIQQLEGASLHDLAALVEPRLAAGRWSGVADPVLAAAGSVAPVVPVAEVASAPGQGFAGTTHHPPASALPAQQLTLTVAAPPKVETVVEKPPPPIPREPAAQKLAPEPAVQATRPAPAPAPPSPVPPPRSETLEDEAPTVKSRVVMWASLAAAAVVIALLAWFLVADRGESEAPAADSAGASAIGSSEPEDPVAVAEEADLSIASDGTTGEASVEEAVVEPASGESAAMEAEAAAIEATNASLAAESKPIQSAVEPATVPAREAAAPVSSPANRDSGASVSDTPAGAGQQASARARRLVALDHGVEGSTEVLSLRFDVPLAKDDVFAALIGPDPPRYLLRLRGIEQQWRPPELQVGSSLVQRVRTGLHSTPRGSELHIVIDLGTRAVEHSWAIEGDALRVRLTPRAP